MKNKSKQDLTKKEKLLIGQTLETKDKYLPYNKKTSQILKESRPVIIVDKITNKRGEEEFVIVPTGTKESKHSSYYGKHGIKRYRHNIEVRDNEGKPISQNEKFKKTKNCTKIPEQEAIKIYDNVLNHTSFSSENNRKVDEFKSRIRNKKSKN